MPSSFLAALRAGALVADGAMGTELHARGFLYDVNYENLNLSRPEVVRGIHQAYARAGARVLETNTFGANRARLARHGLEGLARAINLAAARLAREAAPEGAFVVGALGPTGAPLDTGAGRREAEGALREQAAALADGGVDALLVETMTRPDELALALAAARREAPGLPLVAQMVVNERLELEGGAALDAAGARLAALGADALGVNCSDGPLAALALERLRPLGLPLTAMPHAGLPRETEGLLAYPETPEAFGRLARRLFALGAALVGGCCGTTPEHVRRVAEAAREGAERPAAPAPD
ncbi:MAG TPA: homocysteine S-methyltransferase family protein [Polyangiaceae bacterium]|nr:homocysteine S-methyltransferase family protein [Polyangiaceae bacterium]